MPFYDAGWNLAPFSSIILYITNIVKHRLHVWHPVVCFSGRRRVAARTCLPVDSPRETAAAVPPATGGTRHGHSCGGHCPRSIQHSRQPPGTEINISSPHPCNQGKRLNSIKGGCNEILGIHFHIFKLPIAAKTEAIYLLVWAQHRQRSSARVQLWEI